MDDELLCRGIESQAPVSYSSCYLSFFLSFQGKFVSQVSQEVCNLDSSNLVVEMENE